MGRVTQSATFVIDSSLQYVGLFGFLKGATIRNVVLDSSCSVVCYYSGSDSVYVGGIIGYYNDCTIENTVNMASVVFTGNTTGTYNGLFLGGIAGYLYASYKDVIVKNCANYGSITHSGTVSSYYPNIGGIVGYSSGSSAIKVFIQNCLNYGAITHNETASYSPRVGGILGQAWSGTNSIENCVSAGKITSNKAPSSTIIGSIVGGIAYSTTTITHCYWTSDVGNYSVYGLNQSAVGFDSETKQVELNTATVDSLNSYNSSWNKWLLNTNNNAVTFKVNNGKALTFPYS